MNYSGRELARFRNPILLLGAMAWTVLILGPGGLRAMTHCPVMNGETAPASLMAGFFLMLVAMMSPVLIAPLWHIHRRSFKSRRARSAALFVIGYGAIWMTIGGALWILAIAMTPRPNVAAAGVATVAIVWQCSPWKQRCLNRCHAHGELAAFGAKADRDALLFGVTHAVWCAGSCWALMLLPMLLTRGHSAAMAAVTVLIAGERLEHPAPPCWRWRGFGKLKRIVVAQARIRLHTRIPA